MRKIKFLLLFILSSVILKAQKKQFLKVNLPMGIERHTFIIDDGPPEIKGKKKDQNFFYGIEILYSRKVATHWEAFGGLGYNRQTSKIFRDYNRKFFNDYNAQLYYTDKVNYHLISFPFGINYIFKPTNNFSFTFGNICKLNYSFAQNYSPRNDRRTAFYFFGFSDDLSIGARKFISKNSFLEFQPYLRVFNNWRKDEVLFEDQKQFHDLPLSAVGVNASVGLLF